MERIVAIDFNPADRTLKQFGFVAFVAFVAIALLAWFEAGMFAFGLGQVRRLLTGALFGLSALCLVFSLVYPRGNRPIFIGLSLVTYPIGVVVSYVLMAFLFFVVLGVPALVMRLVGRDSMKRAYERSARSYWSERTERPTRERYFRQF